MKKSAKILLIIAAVLLLLGVAICVAALAMGADPIGLVLDGTYTFTLDFSGKDNNNPGRDGEFGQRPDGVSVSIAEGENNYSVSSDIKELSIDWVSGKVKIVKGEGNAITFSESAPGGIEAEDRLHYSVEGKTLKISCCDNGGITIGINIDSGCENKELVVSVPYELAELYVDTTSADVEIENISFGATLDVNTSSGDLRATGIDCAAVVLNSTSGDMAYMGACREFYADTTSGEISFTGSCIDFEADSTSGEVKADFVDMPREISADTVSGAVSFVFPSDASFELEYDTVSGDFNCEFPVLLRDGDYVVGSGGAEVDVDTTSGGLKIKSK